MKRAEKQVEMEYSQCFNHFWAYSVVKDCAKAERQYVKICSHLCLFA